MKLKFLATGIGSMPFSNAEQAVDVSLSKVGDAPFWPQLPRRAFTENMEIQYCEGMPSVVIDRENGRIYFDTASDYYDKLAAFYETYLAAMDPETGDGNCAALAITPEFSRGIYAMEKRLRSLGRKLPFIKVQTTGPCSFALTIVDQNKRAMYYNEEFRDLVVKALAMKCRWQIQKFQPFAQQVICFVDEPILSAFGSSTYVSLKRNDIVSHLAEMVAAIHADRALAGVHCCGNTEWSILVDAAVDIINFDAYGYGETITMYPDAVRKHLERGGMLAYGVVPTSPAVRQENVESLRDRLERLMDQLASKGIDRQLIVEQAILTPSCGTGSLESEDALRVFDLLDSLSKTMREKYS
jgi:methionine synthase II (cobalamin-independent)